MKDFDPKSEDYREFSRFLQADPLSPRPTTDAAILQRAETGRLSLGAVLAKFIALQVSSGLVTLAICPQFGIGSRSHAGLLHALHTFEKPALYYLSCGLFFVLFGALISGLAANRRDLKVLGRRRYAYFAGYSVCAYGVFMAWGGEAFLLGSLFWIAGALAGHLAGFTLGSTLRRTTA
jgi:hypothetical protein